MLFKQIIYYTCNTHLPAIDDKCRAQLLKSKLPIVAISLNKALDFGNIQLTTEGTRSPLMMHKQILMGLEAASADIVFLCESDVLYSPTHFDAIPKGNTFLYNTNVWKLRWTDGLAVWTDDMQQVSGLAAAREPLLDFYRQRVAQIEKEGFNRHYEPGVKQTVGLDHVASWQSDEPNVCIRHDSNITQSKWSPDEFRNKRYAKGWQETYSIPYWGPTKDLLC